MIFKANLHLHTSEDPKDSGIKYNIYQAIDEAKKFNFNILALTCHEKFVFQEKMGVYAKKKGMLLIPGIEKKINRKEVVILNCQKDIENIQTFSQLREYKRKNPDVFVLAPHPYFPSTKTLGRSLEKNIDIFDAIEFSWFWHPKLNFNKKAKEIAKRYNKPYLATSDTHILKYLDISYALIEADRLEAKEIFKAIREKKIKNKSQSLSLLEMIKILFIYEFKLK